MKLSNLGTQQLNEIVSRQIDFVKQFRAVDAATVDYLVKYTGKKFQNLTVDQFSEIVANGISGQYGELIKADPQTFFKWIHKYLDEQNSSKNYLSTPLVPVNFPPSENFDWCKETNRAYEAFKKNVSPDNFHHCIYDRLICDSEIPLNTYLKFYDRKYDLSERQEFEIRIAKRKALAKFFAEQQKNNRPF